MKNTFKIFSLLIVGFLSIQNNVFSQQKGETGPNVVFVMLDDLGWVDVSTGSTNDGRGSHVFQTPNMDRIATEGMSFTYAYAQQNCAPTRAALISGLYATHPDNGVFNVTSLSRETEATVKPLLIQPPVQQHDISTSAVSIFDMFKSAGYTTCFVGKAHGTGSGTNLGVDVSATPPSGFKANVGGQQVESYYFALKDDVKGWTFSDAAFDAYAQPYTEQYVNTKLKAVANGNTLSLLPGTAKHQTDVMGDYCEMYLADAAKAETPFFLYVPFHAVHTKIEGRPDLVQKYRSLGLSDKEAEYAALIETADQNVGRIYNALKDPNGDGDYTDDLSDNTIFVLYSDNGGLRSNAPLVGRKGNFTEGGIRVPLMVKYPNVIEPNSISNQAVHSIDFFPTLAEMIGADVTALKKDNGDDLELDGVSFAKVLSGEKTRLDRENLFWHFPGYMDTRQRPNSMIQKRIGNDYYKLRYFYETGQSTLYHLNSDISENHDLLQMQDPRDVQLAEIMLNDLKQWLQNENALTGKWLNNGATVPYPDSILLSDIKKMPPKLDTIRWTQNKDFEKWEIKQGVDSIAIRNDQMKIYFQSDGNGRSDVLLNNLNIVSSVYDRFRLVAKNQSQNKAFRFSHHASNAWYDARNETNFFTLNGTQFRPYVLDLNGTWVSVSNEVPVTWQEAGVVDNIILRFANKVSGNITIDTLEFLPADGGMRQVTFKVEGDGSVNYASGKYMDGQQLELVAIPTEGYQFSAWEGGATGSENPKTITVNSNALITARFTALPRYALQVSAQNGTVQKLHKQSTYAQGSIEKLTATPNEGYVFAGWAGDVTGMANPLHLRVDSALTVTANFVKSSTSLTPLKTDKLSYYNVFPNPSKGVFNVLAHVKGPTLFRIFTLNGIEIQSGQFEETSEFIMQKGAGVYFIMLENSGKKEVQKLVVKG